MYKNNTLQIYIIIKKNMKLIQCKSTPSKVFVIHEYTKIVYSVDWYYCVREIVGDDKPVFVQKGQNCDRVCGLHSRPNTIISVEAKQLSYWVAFYQGDLCSVVPAKWEEEVTQVQSILCANVLVLFGCGQKGSYLMFINCDTKRILSQMRLNNSIKQITTAYHQSISLLTHDQQILLYRYQPSEKAVLLHYSYQHDEEVISHCWVEEQLILITNKTVEVILDKKPYQTIEGLHRPQATFPIICGFYVVDGCVLKVFKKIEASFNLACEIQDPHLMDCQSIKQSPQEDILAYYAPRTSSIVYSLTITAQIQKATRGFVDEFRLTETLETNEISHDKSFRFAIYPSRQSWFVVMNGPEINIYSSVGFEKYLSIKLQKNQQENKMLLGNEVKINSIVVHPNRLIIAVALEKKIRIYYVLFNQIKLLKEINCAFVKDLLFNHSGSLLTAIIRGKSGVKVYLYKVDEIKNQYDLLENLSIGKQAKNFVWDSLDSNLYAFNSDGYFYWSSQNHFKVRNEVYLDTGYEIQNGFITSHNQVVVWNSSNVSLFDQQQLKQTFKSPYPIKTITEQNGVFFFIFQNGKIIKTKQFDIDQSANKFINLKLKDEKFSIQPLQNNKFIFRSHDNNLMFYQWNKETHEHNDFVCIDKNKITQVLQKHKLYEQKIRQIQEKFTLSIDDLSNTFRNAMQIKEKEYMKELDQRIRLQKILKDQKLKLQGTLQRNLTLKDEQSKHQIRQLQRLYQRKIALTTNKLLTSEEMAFRDKMICQSNLKDLEEKHGDDIQLIRNQYGTSLKNLMDEKSDNHEEIVKIKRQYETKLSELEKENEYLLKRFQQKNDDDVSALRLSIMQWEKRYSQVLSRKNNIQKQLEQELDKISILNRKVIEQSNKKARSERSQQQLIKEVKKIESVLQQKNEIMQFYEKKIEDLEKSNEILKYRVNELKNINDPQEEQIKILKGKLNHLENQYDQITQHSHEQEQIIEVIKKEKKKLKELNDSLTTKNKRIEKNFQDMIDRTRNAAKFPIQQIRAEILGIVEKFSIKESKNLKIIRAQSPLGQLNRIRDHLEVCLEDVMASNKKNEEQRKKQVTKKNIENSKLLGQINDLKKQNKQLEDQLKQKNNQISRLLRGEHNIHRESQNSFPFSGQSLSKDKTKTRQTFYEKSLFKSYWKEKRLKTEEGTRRKKSAYSVIRDKSRHNQLLVQSPNEEIDEYKRIIEQKQLLIQRLIAKIQKN